jgi:hypothetical protein
VARQDLLDLVLVLGLTVAAVAVGGARLAGYFGARREAAHLETLVHRAGDYEKSLAAVEAKKAASRAETGRLKARLPRDFKLEALDSRIRFKADELGLAVTEMSTWIGQSVVEDLGPGAALSLQRYDRSIEFKGPFKDIVAMLAAAESWDELVAIRTLRARRTPTPGEAAIRLEISAYQLVKEEKRP